MLPEVRLALRQQHVKSALAGHQRHQHGGRARRFTLGDHARFRVQVVIAAGGNDRRRAVQPQGRAGAEFLLIETVAQEANPISAAFCMG